MLEPRPFLPTSVFWPIILPQIMSVIAGTALPAVTFAQEPLGKLRGVVRDARTKEPVIDAGVEVVGTGKKTRSDIDGRFELSLPPGTYEIRVFAPFYRTMRVQNLKVEAGVAKETEVVLPPQENAATETVEVVAKRERSSTRMQLRLRREAPTVSENIGAQEIRSSPDSDAGEVVQRLPAVVVKDNKFINVRGLNERYSSARLQGSRLPSTDPERRVVPLDLFPAEFIDSISLVKTFQPDLPGDFSGALADIFLKPFPEQRRFSISLKSGANTNATARAFDTYHAAGPADYFGLGEHFRRLPDALPDRASEVNLTAARQQAFARAFDNIWEPSRISAPPDLGFSANGGGTWGRLGLNFAGVYHTEYNTQNLRSANVLFAGDQPQFADRFDSRVSTFDVRLGGLLSAGYRITPQNSLYFNALVNRNATDETRKSLGVEDSTGHVLSFTRFRYTVNTLAFGQLAGEHQARAFKVLWRTAYGYTTQDQPDGRLQTRDVTEGGIFTNNNFGGRRLFGSLEERLTDSGIDFEVSFRALPSVLFDALKLRFGPAYSYRQREQNLRQFIFDVKNVPELQALPTEELLAPENLGPNPRNRGVQFREETKPRDSFQANEETLAGYLFAEMPVYRRAPEQHEVQLLAGVRTEYWHLAEQFFGANGAPAPLRRTDIDPLPAVAVRYRPRPETNLRLSWSKTIARPDLRELSPTQYPEPGSLETKAGDPTLQSASITNYDFRWEWFYSDEELLSASVFYKDFNRPIEQVVFYEGANRVFKPRNAQSAKVLGLELESRASLRHIHPLLDGLFLTTNITWADSEAQIRQESGTIRKRSLQGQAPFIVNASLLYRHTKWGEFRLLYNTAGERIEAAGPPEEDPETKRALIPDVFEQRRDQLDFAYLRTVSIFATPVQVKLSAENILNDQFVFTQAGLVQKRFATGTRLSCSLAYNF